MEKAVSFLKNLTKNDNIIVVFHNDADGCCSCAIMNNFLEKTIGKKADYIISQPMPPEKNLMNKIRLSMPTKIIFLDLGVDQNPSLIKKLEGDCEILIIDHHQILNSMNSQRTVHYNPMFKKRVYQSASYLAYKICSEITNMDERLWTAMVGIIGDYNVEDSSDVIKKAEEKYGEYIKSTEQEDLHKSMFGQLADMISAAKASKITCEEIVRIISSSQTAEDMASNNRLSESYSKVQEEIDRILIDAKSSIDSSKPVIFYKISSSFNVHSPISTQISKEYPKKMIIVWEEIGNKIKISARNQGKNYNVGRVLREASRELKHASAGGHEAAGGVSMKKDDWEEFKQKLETIVSSS